MTSGARALFIIVYVLVMCLVGIVAFTVVFGASLFIGDKLEACRLRGKAFQRLRALRRENSGFSAQPYPYSHN